MGGGQALGFREGFESVDEFFRRFVSLEEWTIQSLWSLSRDMGICPRLKQRGGGLYPAHSPRSDHSISRSVS